MIDQRYALVSSFLALPHSRSEQGWLIEAIRTSKKSSSKNMDSWERYGASNFARASEEDPYVAEPSFFTDFDHAKADFQHWLAIEEELYLSIGYENFFDEVQSEKICHRIKNGTRHTQKRSLLLKMIADNLVEHIVYRAEKLERAQSDLEGTQKEVNDYGPENKNDFDDDWFRLQNELDSAEEHLNSLKLILPQCWDSIMDFASSPRGRMHIPNHCLKSIAENDQDGFISNFLRREKIDEPNHSNENQEDWESDVFSCWGGLKTEAEQPENGEGVSKNKAWDDDIPF